MPILDLQRRFRELGRIRLGEKGEKKKADGSVVAFPVKLTEFRLTSGSRELLDVAAELYGGEVAKWDGAPNDGQWQLKTGADRLDVYLPPGEPITQWNEMWSGGGCVRRCDGRTNVLTDGPCECPADLDQRIEASKKGNACKPTTRLSVMLPRLPDVGVWRLETHGYNAALELPGTVAILQAALDRGQMIPAQLRLEQRTSVKDGQTRQFVVPVLELPTLSFHTLSTGEAPAGAVTMGAVGELEPADQPALPPGDTQQQSGVATAEQRKKVSAALEELDGEMRAAAAKGWKAKVGPSLKAVERFTGDHAAAALAWIDEVRTEAHDRRRKHVRAKLGEAGVRDEADVDALVLAATTAIGVPTSSTAELSDAQVAAVIDQLQPLLASREEPTDEPAEVA